jgi:mRNA interferase RelE/StbE
LAWTIEFAQGVEKDLRKLGPQASRRIIRFLRERIAALDDPRLIGGPLHGPELGAFWKYRVGPYRVVVQLEDELVTLVVVRAGHRRDIYR